MSSPTTIALTCPNCYQQFVSAIVPPGPATGRRRTDFQLQADGAQPLPYEVHLCTRCGFAGPQQSFELGELPFEVSQRVWDELAPRVDEARSAASEKFEFAARVASWSNASLRDVADLWLRAAWCCVDEGDIEAERFYRRHAVWAFEECLDAYEAVDREERPAMTYLIGELWRRIGDESRAREWFERVEDEVTNKRDQAWIVYWAKRQRVSPREWFTERLT